MYCALAERWLDDNEGDFCIFVRPAREDECAGLYEGEQILGYSIAVPDGVRELTDRAWEVASKAYQSGTNNPAHRKGVDILELIERTVDDKVDLRCADSAELMLAHITYSYPIYLSCRVLGDGADDPTIYEWLTEHSEIVEEGLDARKACAR
jgi:hypothetical protein